MSYYYLAVDIGASSGRHIIGYMESGKLQLEEMYRFSNGTYIKNGKQCWDYESLVENVILGIQACADAGKKPTYMGIDTWGVDFLLLDKNDKVIGDSVGYRDTRTDGMDQKVYEIISEEELYLKTGIQKQVYNTIFQLMALKTNEPQDLFNAESLLMMPDYLNFRLTGVKHQEYTNATTTGLVNVQSETWDYEIVEKLSYPKKLFCELKMPGEVVGNFSQSIKTRLGFDVTVIHPASHDTASAVIAVPTNSGNAVYLSSGTWSLMGIETKIPNSSKESKLNNFTNEGGIYKRYRYLKNIMGLWIIQSIRKELDNKYSFAELCDMAASVGDTGHRIHVNDNVFLSPKSMIQAIEKYCDYKSMPLDVMLSCVYHSLADYYALTIKELEKNSGKKISDLHIIGGGSKDDYLNELTAKACKISVFAGPTEATAIGNLIAQMLGTGLFDSIEEARNTIFNSFNINKIEIYGDKNG